MKQSLDGIQYSDYIGIYPIEFGDCEERTYFGMTDLSKAIQNYFNQYKIDKQDIIDKTQNATSNDHFIATTKENILLSSLCDLEQFKAKCRNTAAEIVISHCIIKIFFFTITKTSLSDNCNKDLAQMYHYTITDQELENFKKTLEERINQIRNTNDIADQVKKMFDIDIVNHRKKTEKLILQAQAFIEYIEDKIDIDYLKPIIINAIDDFNQGINDLNDLHKCFSQLKIDNKEDNAEFIYEDS